ncbi:hypothetical protein AB0E64_10995 [Streptomyces caelestis]|uniref:hypothetical protein n=1 Tax=Streptomyces caelestis TaxID=36816 RepID=UPI0021AAD369|nr:hypothetical protein [Streptomyces caelestis]
MSADICGAVDFPAWTDAEHPASNVQAATAEKLHVAADERALGIVDSVPADQDKKTPKAYSAGLLGVSLMGLPGGNR